MKPNRLTVAVVVATLLAILSIVASAAFYQISLSDQAILAAVTLTALALLSDLSALTITEGGATTSMDYIPQLAAILLIGPFGAVVLTAITWFVFQAVFLRKSTRKIFYNTSQVTVAVFLASSAYVALGGGIGVASVDFSSSFLPFVGATATYFIVNFVAVTYIISVSESQRFGDAWRKIGGNIIVFDFAMSFIAFLVAYLYVQWGPIAILLTLIPLIGLRYSYGVNLKLRQLNTDLLRVLVKTLEAQDPYTSGHSIRVAEGAKAIADELGLGANHTHNIETAALLHDIGKIDMEYHTILRQEEPLTPNQRKAIKEHPDRGVQILESVRAISDDVLDCIRHHHERYDGTGYPEGLSGEDIPLGARIIMVSDTLDAMRTARPYRDPVSIPDIREELLALSGKQFDPQVVEAAIEAGLLEADRYEDPIKVANRRAPFSA